MRWMKVAALSLVATLTSVTVTAYGPETESQKKEDRFIHCLLAMEEANVDQDDRLTRDEYQPFLRYLSQLMFDEEVVKEGELPTALGHLYVNLVPASGAPGNAHSIDIFGAKMDEVFLNEVSASRLKSLHTVCEMVMKELAMLGPRTEAPIFLMDMMETEQMFEEEDTLNDGDMEIKTQGDIDFEQAEEALNSEMISVHSSFLMSNFRSMSHDDLNLNKTGVLYAAYEDFIDDLLNNICPTGEPCPDSELELKEEEDERIEEKHERAKEMHQKHEEKLRKEAKEEREKEKEEAEAEAEAEAEKEKEEAEAEAEKNDSPHGKPQHDAHNKGNNKNDKEEEEESEAEPEEPHNKGHGGQGNHKNDKEEEEPEAEPEAEEPHKGHGNGEHGNHKHEDEEAKEDPVKSAAVDESHKKEHEKQHEKHHEDGQHHDEEKSNHIISGHDVVEKLEEEAELKEEAAKKETNEHKKEEDEKEAEVALKKAEHEVEKEEAETEKEEHKQEHEHEHDNKGHNNEHNNHDNNQHNNHDHGNNNNNHNDHDQHHNNNNHDQHHNNNNHNNRRLCSADYHPLRRMLCGVDGRRALLKAAVLADADLYQASEHPCPIGFQRHEHDKRIRPICHTVYVHFDVIVEWMGNDIKQIEHNYVAATKTAIADGMLQEALKRVDPDGPFVILGAGEHRYPHENFHHVDGEVKAHSYHKDEQKKEEHKEDQKDEQKDEHKGEHKGEHKDGQHKSKHGRYLRPVM